MLESGLIAVAKSESESSVSDSLECYVVNIGKSILPQLLDVLEIFSPGTHYGHYGYIQTKNTLWHLCTQLGSLVNSLQII